MTERTDTLNTYVSDMVALEKHVLEAIERQIEDDDTAAYPEVRTFLRQTKLVLEEHIDHLEAHEKTLGNGGSTVKEALSAALGIAAGWIDKVRPNTVSKMLRDDYAALNLVAVSYTMLHTTGLALTSPVTADLALKHLKHVTPLITDINKLIPRVVALELVDDTEQIDLTVVDTAVQNTQGAWDGEHVHGGSTSTT